ncbi:MAG: hypothetical protein NTZ17_17410 [Phycisphaerae bacterium]|nr:hypothetical protein [Phycisphaerae bacterium]
MLMEAVSSTVIIFLAQCSCTPVDHICPGLGETQVGTLVPASVSEEPASIGPDRREPRSKAHEGRSPGSTWGTVSALVGIAGLIIAIVKLGISLNRRLQELEMKLALTSEKAAKTGDLEIRCQRLEIDLARASEKAERAGDLEVKCQRLEIDLARISEKAAKASEFERTLEKLQLDLARMEEREYAMSERLRDIQREDVNLAAQVRSDDTPLFEFCHRGDSRLT